VWAHLCLERGTGILVEVLSRDSTTTFYDSGDMFQSRKRGRESMGKLPVCTEY
jgi:hypothetical protein